MAEKSRLLTAPFHSDKSGMPNQLFKKLSALYFLCCVCVGIWGWKNKELVLEKFLLSRPVRKEMFWEKYPRLTFEDRIFEAPKELLEQVYFENLVHGIPQRPQLVPLTPDLRLVLSTSMKQMPESVKREIGPALIAVLPAANIGSNGITFTVISKKSALPMGAVVLIDVALLDQEPNKWISTKENAIFQLEQLKLETVIEGPAAEPTEGQMVRLDEFQGLTFLLLHEFGHISALVKNLSSKAVSKEFFFPPESFAELNWAPTVRDGKTVLAARKWSYDIQPPLSFFGSRKTKIQEIESENFLQALRGSTFATMYSASSPIEDYAEAYAVYHHTQSLGRPYETILKSGEEVRHSLKNCMSDARCPALKEHFEKARISLQTQAPGQ